MGWRSAIAVGLTLALGGCAAGEPGAPSPRTPRAVSPAIRALVREARPIGRGPRFTPPAPSRVAARCRARFGPRFPVHLELFAADRVVLVATGIGVGPPRRRVAGRIVAAGCFARIVTLDPTGVLLVARRAGHPTLGDLFTDWGQPLGRRRLASFTGRLRVFVDGRRRSGNPRSVPLTPDAEIVVETGPPIPPHRSFDFAPPARPRTLSLRGRRSAPAP